MRGGTANSFTWTVGLFRSVNKDDLLFVADNPSGFGYFKNFGKTRRQGIELGASAQLAKGFTAGANYTYLDATFQSPEVIDGSGNSSNSSAIDGFPGVEGTINIQPGDHIPLVPRQILKLFADVELGNGWLVGADVIAQSSAIARGNENGQHQPDGVFYLGPGTYPGYAFLNLRAEFRPNKALRLFGQVGNVFNTKYSTAAQLGATGFNDAGNFVARPFPANANGDFPVTNATFYGPGAPRTFSGGLQYWF